MIMFTLSVISDIQVTEKWTSTEEDMPTVPQVASENYQLEIDMWFIEIKWNNTMWSLIIYSCTVIISHAVQEKWLSFYIKWVVCAKNH